jgi:hypothetical protein
MRPLLFCAVLALPYAIASFAQDGMPSAGPHMGKPLPATTTDLRQIVPLTEPERALVAERMRKMLTSVDGVVDGLARGDARAVAEAASRSGTHMMQDLPPQIRKQFPPAFAQMGMAAHKVFDQIAHETKSVKNPAPTLKRLAEAIKSCDACHAAYRFAPPR